MAHDLTAVPADTPADVTSNLAVGVPDGGDNRTAASLYGAFQALLNLVAALTNFISGGDVGLNADVALVVFLRRQFRAASLQADGVVHAGTDLQVDGDAQFDANISVDGDINALDNIFVTNDIAVGGLIAGATVTYRDLIGSASNASYGPGRGATNRADAVKAPTLSGTVNYTIDDTGATNGMRILFANLTNTDHLVIKAPGGSTIVTLYQGTGIPQSALLSRIAGTWTILEVVPTD